MKQCQVRLDENLYQALTELKVRDGIPVAESLRRAVIEYLQKRGVKNEGHQSPQNPSQPNS